MRGKDKLKEKINAGNDYNDRSTLNFVRVRKKILSKIIVILAFAGIFLQTFSQAVIIGWYYANRDYIAKNLCENRNKPQLHCNGKCCLKKKLEKESRDQQLPTSRNQKHGESVDLFCNIIKFDIIHSFEYRIPVRYFIYGAPTIISFNSSVFHPPTV